MWFYLKGCADMTNDESIEKIKFVKAVLEKVTRGEKVDLQERINACQYAIEVLCTDDSNQAKKKRRVK